MFTTALMFGFGGVGVYFYDPNNKNPHMVVNNPYIHIDIRPWSKGRTIIWYREKGKYEYRTEKVMERITRDDALIPFPYWGDIVFNVNNFEIKINRTMEEDFKAEIKDIDEIIEANSLEILFVKILKVINKTINFSDYLINNSD